MRMTIIFASFALLSFLGALWLPYIGGGVGIDMMLIYLGLAGLSAILGLLRSRPAR